MDAGSVSDSAAFRSQDLGVIDSIINVSSTIITKVEDYNNASPTIRKLGDFGAQVNGQLKENLRNGVATVNDPNLDMQLRAQIDACIIKLQTDLIAADNLLDKCIKKGGRFWKILFYLIKVFGVVRSLQKQEKKLSLFMSSADIHKRPVPSQLLLKSNQFEITGGETAEQPGITPPHSNIFLVEGYLRDCEAGKDISGNGSFILEDRGYHHNGRNKLDNEKDIKTLASKLVKAGPHTGIPRLVGYRNAECRNSYELVFAIPSEFGRPRSLHSFLLDSAIRSPPLTYRFEICGQLAKAVLFTHNLNIVHKNIRPENIILLPPRDANPNILDCQQFKTLFLTNWELVRDLADLTYFVGHDDWKRGIYQHPKRQGRKAEHQYTMGHDVYSLGVCMLEIFLWRTFVEGNEVSQLYQERAIKLGLVGEGFQGNTQEMIKKPSVVQTVLIDIARTELPNIVGVSVANLVVKCLTIVENDFRGGNSLESTETGVNYIQHILDVFHDLQFGNNVENDVLLPHDLPPLYRNNTKFRKVRYLGRGSLGDTWLVKSECHAKEHLICKEMFYEDTVRREAVLKAIIQENTLLEIPAHPNIVRFISFDCDKSNNRARIYMEYCYGEDLSSFIRDVSAGRRSLTEDTAWKIIFQMSAALAYLHHGLAVDEDNRFFIEKSWIANLHKNINPENVLLSVTSPDGEIIGVKLCNVGLGKLHAPIQLNGYEAPEISQDDPKWSLKADIYSLGRAIEEFSKNRGIQAINDLVHRCLSQAPESRPSSLSILEIAGRQINAAIPNSSCVIKGWEECMFSTIIGVGSIQTPEGVDQNQPVERLRLLIEDGGDLNKWMGPAKNTPIHVAAETGNLILAQRLLALEVKVDTVNDNGQTALALAAEKGNENLMELLLSRNVSLGELTAIHNLATKYRDEGRLEEAKRILLQVMKARGRVFEEDHPDTLVVMEDLAATYDRLGKPQEVVRIYSQVMVARKRVFGENHPGTVDVMGRLVAIYLQQGRTEDANAVFPRIIQAGVLERTLSENNERPHGWVRYNDRIFDKVKLLGRGRFGVAWLIRRESGREQLVCKEIFYGNADTHLQEIALKTIKQEYSLLKIAAHPNIVQLTSLQWDEPNHMAQLYMEYCDGGDLSRFINDVTAGAKILTLQIAWGIVFQLAAALAYLHHGLTIDVKENCYRVEKSWKAILHRDIKPSNVLVSKYSGDGINVKLCDFGLAKLYVPDLSGTYVGSPGYKAPEIARGDCKWTMKADIYSFGRTIERLSKNCEFKVIDDLVRECVSEVPKNRPNSLKILEDAGRQIRAICNSPCNIQGSDDCMFSTIVNVGSIQTPEGTDQTQPVERLKLLMKDGCDLTMTTKDSTRNTPLHFAAATGNLLLAQRLLELGANADAVNGNQKSASDLATKSGMS